MRHYSNAKLFEIKQGGKLLRVRLNAVIFRLHGYEAALYYRLYNISIRRH